MDEKKENQNNNDKNLSNNNLDKSSEQNLKKENEIINKDILNSNKDNTSNNEIKNEENKINEKINNNKEESSEQSLPDQEKIKKEENASISTINQNEQNNITNNGENIAKDNNPNIKDNSVETNNNNKNEIKTPTNNPNNSQNNEMNDVLSPEEFKKLYNKLHSIVLENKKLDKIKKEFTELLESMTEHLINGDKKDPKIFEMFSSLNFIHDLIIIMSKKNKEINIQIIKFFSVLMTNLSEKHILYFLFNCDFINQHVYEENDSIEGDYLYYYISFVKSLILKISTKTIGFFYHAQTYSFPLLGNCLKFYNHPDSMISNTARNIFLYVLKMKHPPCIDYICTLPMLSYFIFLSCRLRDEIKTLNKKIKRNKEEDCKILYEEIINDIMYMQDIYSIEIVKINYILTNCVFHYLILPVVCNSLIYYSDLNTSMDSSLNRNESFSYSNYFLNMIMPNNNNNSNNTNANANPLLKYCITPELAMYVLNLFLKYIKNETFINLLLSLLFLPKIHYKAMNKLKNPTKDLENYEGDYNKNKTKKKN